MEKLLERLEYLEMKQQIATTYLLIWSTDKEEGLEIPERHFNKLDELYSKYQNSIDNMLKCAADMGMDKSIVESKIWDMAFDKSVKHVYHC